jgi:hypothetical protein
VDISQKWRTAVKLSPMRNYRLAFKAGLHPSTLSKLLNGIEKIKPNDPRVLRIGRMLGVPDDECFSDQKECENGLASNSRER